MRFKKFLGLLAIGGAVAYAQKKRGGEMTVNGFKDSFREAFDSVKRQIETLSNKARGTSPMDLTRSGDVSISDAGSAARSSIADDLSDLGTRFRDDFDRKL